MGILAKRYAQAIFQIAVEKDQLEPWKKDLNRLKEILIRPAFLALLENPRLSVEEKLSVLKGVLGDINSMALNLAGLLIYRRRVRLIEDILREYERLVFKYHGIEIAQLITAIPLEGDERGRLEERVGETLGKKLKLSHRVDARILGGVIIKGEDWIFDGSLKSKLEGLREKLLIQ